MTGHDSRKSTLLSPLPPLVLTQIRTQDTYIRGASALKRGQKLDVHPNRSKDLVRPLPEACSQRLDRVLPVECFSPCQEHLHFKALPDEDLGKDEPPGGRGENQVLVLES
jgi:hypothetical protein